MSFFSRLRHLAARRPGRALLAWFALTLAAAVATPIAHSGALQDICTSTGATSVFGNAAPSAPAAPSHLDCPLCVPSAPPPPAWNAALAPEPPPCCPPRWHSAQREIRHESLTPPGRGPPLA